MWRELKADTIIGSVAQLAGRVPAKGLVCFDPQTGIGRLYDPWEQAFGHDPWSDPTGINQVLDPQYRVRNQLKSTVLKVLCKAAGIGEVSWSTADRTVLSSLAETYRAIEDECSTGMSTPVEAIDVSFSAGENLAFVSSSSATSKDIFNETAQLRDRLVRLEREIFDMRNQVSRLVAQATASFTTAQVSARVDYNPAAAWQKAVERDSTTSPVSNLEELYE